MTKCKFCKDELEYSWIQVGKPLKWKLCNEITGAPHQCNRDAPIPEISSETQISELEYSSYDHSKLWKKNYTPDTKSYHICGDCNNGTQTITIVNCACKINPCKNYCPKCEKHPRLMIISSNPKQRL